MSDPDVVDNGSSFALRSLWISYQVIPGTENPPAEGEVLIRGTGQAETRVFGHPVGGLLFQPHSMLPEQQRFLSHLINNRLLEILSKTCNINISLPLEPPLKLLFFHFLQIIHIYFVIMKQQCIIKFI